MRTICTTVLLALAFFGCTKKEEPRFKWFANGNKFFYDYYTPTDTTKDHRSLLILGDIFYEEKPNNPTNSFSGLIPLFRGSIVVKTDGLYGSVCKDCNWMCTSRFEFMYAPSNPGVNLELPEYGCGATPRSNPNRIIEVGKTIEVPMGKFNVYVMRHGNGSLSYWKADEGLIQFDVHDYFGKYEGSLKLNRLVRP